LLKNRVFPLLTLSAFTPPKQKNKIFYLPNLPAGHPLPFLKQNFSAKNLHFSNSCDIFNIAETPLLRDKKNSSQKSSRKAIKNDPHLTGRISESPPARE